MKQPLIASRYGQIDRKLLTNSIKKANLENKLNGEPILNGVPACGFRLSSHYLCSNFIGLNFLMIEIIWMWYAMYHRHVYISAYYFTPLRICHKRTKKKVLFNVSSANIEAIFLSANLSNILVTRLPPLDVTEKGRIYRRHNLSKYQMIR